MLLLTEVSAKRKKDEVEDDEPAAPPQKKAKTSAKPSQSTSDSSRTPQTPSATPGPSVPLTLLGANPRTPEASASSSAPPAPSVKRLTGSLAELVRYDGHAGCPASVLLPRALNVKTLTFLAHVKSKITTGQTVSLKDQDTLLKLQQMWPEKVPVDPFIVQLFDRVLGK